MEPNNSRLAIASGALFIEVLTTLWNCYGVQNTSRNEVSTPTPLNVRYRYTFMTYFIFITIVGTSASTALLALSWQGYASCFRYLLMTLSLWSMLREVGFVPTYSSYGFLTGKSLSSQEGHGAPDNGHSHLCLSLAFPWEPACASQLVLSLKCS